MDLTRGAFVAVAVTIFLQLVNGSWWRLGFKSSSTIEAGIEGLFPKDACHRLEYLVDKQKTICGENDKLLSIIGNGAKFGIEECQHQFRHTRWNCSTFPGQENLFGKVDTVRSRETAYLYAVTAAGVTFAVTRACSRGELNECGCDNRVRARRPRAFQWGGCSEDVSFGEDFSRKFVDAREDLVTSDGIMNVHNNEAGRRSIRSRMKRVCKCHGMSGSCSMRVCWRRMPDFRTVGEALFAKYEGASHVKLVERRRGRSKKLRAISPDLKKPNKTDLVYLDESPDYCERNDTLGILGTKGRVCNRTSHGLDGCRLLCCGRGYQTRIREVEEKCKCKFVWCCDVVCQICHSIKEEHICN